MLDAYQAAHKTPATDPGKQLRELIEKTPGLKTTFLDQIDKGRLDGFESLATPGALGAYNPYGKMMAVSIDQLNDAAAGKVRTANSLRFTLGHEINHAVTRDARLAEDKALEDSVKRIANGPSPHDYTATLKAYNDSARSREVGAEIAGFNTLAAYVRQQNPNATLGDLYEASPDDMKAYVDFDPTKPAPEAYKLKAGLTINENNVLTYDKSMGLDSDNSKNLEMPSTPGNIKAMGKFFYEENGYPERKVGGALNYIEGIERAVPHAPGHPAPTVNVSLKEVGVTGVPLPNGFNDTSPRLQPPTSVPTTPEPATPAPSASTPASSQQSGDPREQRQGESTPDSNRIPQTASALPSAEKPNRFEQGAAGQLLSRFFDGDPKEAAEKYAQTQQFKDWDQWGKNNHQQQQQLEEQKQATQQEQPSRGFSR